MGKLKDFFEAVVGFAAGSTLVGLVLGKVELGFEAIKSFFVSSFKQNILYFGLSYITSKGSEDTAQRNLGIKRAVTNPVAPRNVIYGKTRVGGTIVQRTVSSKTGSTSQNVLHNVIAVAGHEINNITKVFMDAGKGTVELDLSSDFTSATENSTTVFRCTNSAFVNADNTDAYTSGSLVKLAFEKGDQTAANGYAVAQIPSGSWSTDHKLLGIAYVYINCIYDTEKFTAIPTFSFEVEGKKVFDPVSSSTVYSTNPALIIRDYLMDSTYGFGAVADEINDAASGAGFVQARSDCNDSVSVTGGSESRFTLNGEFVATEEPQRVLETMLSACAGQLLYNNGKFSLFVGKGRTASGTITDDKILAPIQIQTKASGKDLVNGVKATYVRPDDKYIAGEITPYKDSTFLTEDTPTGKASADYENFLDLAFPYTHSTFTAQRLARIALNYERQDQTLSVLVPLDFLSHQVGDIVNLDNDRLGYSGKDFEIIGMSFEFMGDQYLALRLSLKEYSSTIFDFFTYVADPTLPSEPPSGDNTVGSPTGLTLTEGIKDAQVRIHTIRATWTNSVDDKIVTTEVAYKKSTDSDFDAADVSYPSNSFIFNAEPATTYNVKVRHISNTGVSSAYTGTVNLTTSGGQVTLTTGTISGITIESGKLYQGTGTFNNSNTGFFIDSSGQFSLKDKLSFNGTTLSISGNLTVENTITADKIVVGGITLDNLISASDQASSNYLTTFSGAVKIASGGASAGYPAELQIQATEHTNAIGTLQQSQTQLTIRARNNTSNGAIAFQGFNGTTPTNYGNFDASGNLNLNQNLVVSGDLTVSGTTTTINTTNLDVADKNITLNFGAGDTSSNADGAGITIQDAVNSSTAATILWNASADRFDFSHGLRINADNQVLTVGAGGDFSLSHNGTDTFMANNTGHFYITTTSDDKDIIFRTDDGSGGVTSYFRVDGSTENVIYQKNLKLQDNVQAQFGTGEDLKIYHDGNNSYIQDSGIGNLLVLANDFRIRNAAGNEDMLQVNQDGEVKLSFDGTTKLSTISSGINVTGDVSLTGSIQNTVVPAEVSVKINENGYNDGTTYFRDLDIFDGKGNLFVRFDGSTQRVGIGTNAPSNPLDVRSAANIQLKLASTTSSNNSRMVFAPNNTEAWNIGTNISNGDFTFFDVVNSTTPVRFEDGAGNNTLVVDSNSRVGIGTNAPSENLHVIGNILTSGGVKVGDSSADALHFFGILKQGSGSGTTVIDSSRNLTNIGTISSGAITTSGLLTVGSGAGAIKINESFITAISSDNANDINLIANINVFDADDVVIGSTSGQRFNDNIVLRTNGAQAFRLDSSQNATFAGTITSGKIEGTTADADGHILKTDSSTASATDVVLQLRNSSADYNLGFRPRLPAGNMHAGVNADDFGIFTSNSKGISIGNNDKSLVVIHPTDGIEFHTNNTNRFNITTAGNFQLLGTTVIDASRNLANIGSYAGSGDITLTSGSNQLLFAVSNGALELTRGAGGPFIDFKNSTSDDFDSRIMGGNALIFSTGGNGSTATALTLGSDQSATFAGNIEGSLIKATDQFQSISGSRTLVMNANFSGLGAIGMSSNDHLTFVTNNTERMRLDNSGRVGIGISSVTNALGWGSMAQIGGANPALSLRNTNSNQWDIANFGGTFNIYNGANSRFQIDSSGNTTVTGTEFRLGSSSVISRIRTINSSGFTETAFDNFSSGAYQERMRISSSGSVGIAKTNPSSSYKLDVNGKIRSQQEILINTGSLFINEEGEGIHILSANGTEYKLTVSDAGALVITEV